MSLQSRFRFSRSMSFHHGLPPQAYTKETLADAFEWVKGQPESIRKAAANSDALVGLYLSDLRRRQDGIDSYFEKGAPTPEIQTAPVSGEQFKQELKSLAVGLEEFAEPKAKAEPVASPPHMPIHPPSPPPPQYQPGSPRGPASPASPASSENYLVASLDSLSLRRIQSLKSALNLSSDNEALRMVISLGFEKAKCLIPSE